MIGRGQFTISQLAFLGGFSGDPLNNPVTWSKKAKHPCITTDILVFVLEEGGNLQSACLSWLLEILPAKLEIIDLTQSCNINIKNRKSKNNMYQYLIGHRVKILLLTFVTNRSQQEVQIKIRVSLMGANVPFWTSKNGKNVHTYQNYSLLSCN